MNWRDFTPDFLEGPLGALGGLFSLLHLVLLAVFKD